jgi:hypothetical protein
MPANNHSQKTELRKWIEGCFPQLMNRIPLKPVFMDFGSRKMLSSHKTPSLGEWLNSSGFPSFIGNPDVPDGFFACGIYSPAASESLLVMWKENNRYFWLYDRYALYIIRNSGYSIAETQKNLDVAISRWNKGERHVVFLMGSFQEVDSNC